MTAIAAFSASFSSYLVKLLPRSTHRSLIHIGFYGFLSALLYGMSVPGHAQIGKLAPPSSSAHATAPTKGNTESATKSVSSRPTWIELAPMQQQSLKPLASVWDTGMSEPHKRKWLEMSKTYPGLSDEGKAVMHSRMREWVALSPQQRAQARLNFSKTNELAKNLTSDEKKAKWQTYQALSAEEKQQFAAKGGPQPAGAATAVKQVPAQKLAAIPPKPQIKAPVNATTPPPSSMLKTRIEPRAAAAASGPTPTVAP